MRTYPFVLLLFIGMGAFSQDAGRPALIPEPRQVAWTQGEFDPSACRSILLSDSGLAREAGFLKKALEEKGSRPAVVYRRPSSGPVIRLSIRPVDADGSAEAYTLTVAPEEVLLAGPTPHSVFNAIQTFLQLFRSDGRMPACRIVDWPAFPWRGYMTDVGRNFMSVASLKRQIDVMARYKLNVFHFHATEDIAWRLQIRAYPELTEARHMLRNKGSHYTVEEVKDLIRYCKERHITFIPEIDMPGHSAAFRRAMNTDMQSDSGMRIVKRILTEVCETYDVPYIHIGADEVRITNPAFVPEMTRHIGSYGKKVIGWEPGGNFLPGTIRQLWSGISSTRYREGGVPYVDSRQLYLNHMDPLEAVVSVFNRKIGDEPKAGPTALGGILCTWHDRAVAKEDDILTMNPVFPGMIAFAERSWKGGGVDGMLSNISDGDEAAFIEFEGRLLAHKSLYFRGLPFPYVRQSDRIWKLFGPYPNSGDLTRRFAPESEGFDMQREPPAQQTRGGTIVLRHWWAPAIRGALPDPQDSATWYAATRIWSDTDGEKEFWVGFNNLSRSYRTDPPARGTWDAKGSSVRVNGRTVPPPEWARAGQKGDPEIPLTDEGYEYRLPTKIMLHKGWNEVLLKCPVGSFKTKDGNNPAKWMFTFVPVDAEIPVR